MDRDGNADARVRVELVEVGMHQDAADGTALEFLHEHRLARNLAGAGEIDERVDARMARADERLELDPIERDRGGGRLTPVQDARDSPVAPEPPGRSLAALGSNLDCQ